MPKPEKYRIEITESMVNDMAQLKTIFEHNYGNPDILARSTLPSDYQGEPLICIFEVNNKKIKGQNKERIWLHDMLDESGIKYKIEIVGYWAGRKNLVEKQCVSVEEKNEKKVRRLIKKFKRAEIIQETDEIDNIENGLPQVKCNSCGEEIDFDNHKCPYCKAELY